MKKNCVICGNEFEARGKAKTCGADDCLRRRLAEKNSRKAKAKKLRYHTDSKYREKLLLSAHLGRKDRRSSPYWPSDLARKADARRHRVRYAKLKDCPQFKEKRKQSRKSIMSRYRSDPQFREKCLASMRARYAKNLQKSRDRVLRIARMRRADNAFAKLITAHEMMTKAINQFTKEPHE